MYGIIDINNNMDLKTMTYAVETRTSLASNYDGDGVDKGHCVQSIWGTDKLGLMRIRQGAGIATSPEGLYVYHSNAVEIEYLMDGVGRLDYPDGTVRDVYPGDCSITQPGQPHRMEPIVPKHMEIAVMLSCPPHVCDRVKYNPKALQGEPHKCDKWNLKRCAEQPSVDSGDPLVDIKPIYEENTYDVCFCLVTLKPGAMVPINHFISNANCDEIVLVTEGSGIAVYPDKSYALYRDVSMYNYAGQPYKYINTGDSDLVLLCLFSKNRYSDVEKKTVIMNY